MRTAAAALGLVAATGACRLDVALTTKVGDDGSGVFSLRIEADRDLVDIARSTGEDPLAALSRFPQPLPAGWRLTSFTPGGGLVVSLERRFGSAQDLNAGLADLERAIRAQQGAATSFPSLRLERSSSFLRSQTTIKGTIDLTANGLLGAAGLSKQAADQLRSFAAQTAGEYFRFVLRAELPGSASSVAGNPAKVDGGTVTWSPVLGKSLSFAASSSAYNRAGLAAIAAPAIAVALLIVAARWRVRRRRRLRRSRADADAAG